MAGTPTPNYQFPTYAETDTPNLAGAYNQAVNAIDAKIKEVADSIPSDVNVPDATSTTKGIAKLYDSTAVGAGDQDDGGITPKAVDDKIGGSLTGYAPKFTVAAPITYSSNQIGVNTASMQSDGTMANQGVVYVTGKQSDIGTASSLNGTTVPNLKAVRDYVDAKVPTEQQAYTGTAPIVVDNDSHTVKFAASWVDHSNTSGAQDLSPVRDFYRLNAGTLEDIKPETTTQYPHSGATTYPTVNAMRQYVTAMTPDASTSTKGLVQLTTSPASADSTMAVTGSGVMRLLGDRKTNATTNVTVDMLKNLYVDTTTGVVYYKAPTE